MTQLSRGVATVAGGLLVVLLTLPFLGLVSTTTWAELRVGFSDPQFSEALWLSFGTTGISLLCVVLLGTPLAWWLARSSSKWTSTLSVLVDLPIVIPPAVLGVALLVTFGRNGLLGPTLDRAGITVAFTPVAVVLAQVIVSAPFYVQAATNAFREVHPETILVARSLGASAAGAIVRVALPIALPGLAGGAALAWARSLGEFGATLIFAGSLSGRTQTMPLAIFTTLESDIGLAVALSVVLAGAGILVLAGVRFLPLLAGRRLA